MINEEKNDQKFSFFLADFNEFPIESLSGRVSLITDIKGAFRYGLNPAGTIKKMGTLLKEGGLALIDFGYGLGIDPPSLIKDEYLALGNKAKYGTGSKMLLLLWFHTIKVFDVIYENMDLEDSRRMHSEVMEKPEKCDFFLHSDEFMIIRRNNHPIEIEELVPNPTFIKTWSERPEKDYDSFWPRYSWKISDASEALLSKIKWLNM